MKKIVTLVVTLAVFELSFSQTDNSSVQRSIQQQKLDALKGTYALKSNSRTMSMLPSDLADIITRNRKEKEVNRIKLNEEVELIIYPSKEISIDGPTIKQ